MIELAWRCSSALVRVLRLGLVRPVVEYKAAVLVQSLVECRLVLYIAEVVLFVVDIAVEPAQVERILVVQRVLLDLKTQPGVVELIVRVPKVVPS